MRTSLRIGLAMAVMSAVVVASVGPATGARRGVTTAPTTEPAAVRLADAKPLADLVPANLQANLTDKLSPPQTDGQTVYFGEVDEYDGDGDDAKLLSSLPIVAVKDGADWRAVPLVGRGLADAGWKYVGAGPRPREVWGALDTSAGDDGPDFVVAHSVDGGATFTLQTFRKPCPQAAVFDFAMTHDGQGRVTLALDETVGRHRPGLYHYETTDGGHTWATRPRFEPDAMVRADAVPDDEQPDVAGDNGKPSKTAWHRPSRRPLVTLRTADITTR